MTGKLAEVVVSARGAARIRAGHPWVFRQDVVRGPGGDARAGGPALVRVVDGRGRALARATWAAEARLALRVLARAGDPDGEEDDLLGLVARRLAAALAWRQRLALDRDAYRVAHAESDGLPGLIVDRYADVAVVQTTSVAMDAVRSAVADEVARQLGVRLVVERDDGSARDFEGLPRRTEVLAGRGEARVVYRLGANTFEADLLADGKTGGFLDQADNHAAVAALAQPGASALDAFTHHGGFALALGRRGGPVLAVDEAPEAAARAAANARRNDLPNVRVERADAFELLRRLEAERARFDVVVLDPPALAKRGHEAAAARAAAGRAYKELVLRGARLTAPGGVLVACSCSGRVSRADFDAVVAEAVADSGRVADVLARAGAGRDHPELVGVPETGHLKCWILRVR